MGFIQVTDDPCLHIASEGEIFLITVYVDDILLMGRDEIIAAVNQTFLQIS